LANIISDRFKLFSKFESEHPYFTNIKKNDKLAQLLKFDKKGVLNKPGKAMLLDYAELNKIHTALEDMVSEAFEHGDIVEKAVNKENKKLSELKDSLIKYQRQIRYLTGMIEFVKEDEVVEPIEPIEEEKVPVETITTVVTKVVKPRKPRAKKVKKVVETVLDSISDTEYNDFLDNGIVSDERLNNIADKVKNKKKLSDRENNIFVNKTSDINNIIAKSIPIITSVPGDKDDINIQIDNLQRRRDEELVKELGEIALNKKSVDAIAERSDKRAVAFIDKYDAINAKYDEELTKLLNKSTNEDDINAQKADIEKRRDKSLASITWGEGIKGTDIEIKEAIIYNSDGTIEHIGDQADPSKYPSDWRLRETINNKYDAELDAIGKPPIQKAAMSNAAKRADIFDRWKWALKTNEVRLASGNIGDTLLDKDGNKYKIISRKDKYGRSLEYTINNGPILSFNPKLDRSSFYYYKRPVSEINAIYELELKELDALEKISEKTSEKEIVFKVPPYTILRDLEFDFPQGPLKGNLIEAEGNQFFVYKKGKEYFFVLLTTTNPGIPIAKGDTEKEAIEKGLEKMLSEVDINKELNNIKESKTFDELDKSGDEALKNTTGESIEIDTLINTAISNRQSELWTVITPENLKSAKTKGYKIVIDGVFYPTFTINKTKIVDDKSITTVGILSPLKTKKTNINISEIEKITREAMPKPIEISEEIKEQVKDIVNTALEVVSKEDLQKANDEAKNQSNNDINKDFFNNLGCK